jgi:murein tripeptide amidase MpaA
MKLICLLLACAVIVFAEFKSYEGYRVLRVNIKNENQLRTLSSLEEDYDFWTDARLGWVDVMAKPEQQLEHFLDANKIDYSLHIPNLERIVQEERQVNKQTRAMNWENYQRLTTIHEFVDQLTGANPNVSSVISIGTSTQGRDLKLVKIGRPGAQNKPAIWIDAGIHAREWISPAIATWVINQLITNQENNDILDNVDFYILPVTNVDGYEYSHTDERFWRKTRSYNGNANCYGVDPNRNFEFHWGGAGTSPNLCSEIYKGPEAWSEPETRAMRDFILNTDANWQVYIALHSYAQMWLTPWGYTYDLPEDYDELKALGVLATEALTAVHGTKYDVGSVTELLSPGAGGSDDWAKGLGPFKYSYTVEVRDTGRYGFALPPEQIIPTSEETWASFQTVARFLARK